jgi:hypothetical protein
MASLLCSVAQDTLPRSATFKGHRQRESRDIYWFKLLQHSTTTQEALQKFKVKIWVIRKDVENIPVTKAPVRPPVS